MQELFFKRCLHRSLTFLKNLKVPCNEITLTSKDQFLINMFNSKDYNSIQKNVCQVNCICCETHQKFLSIYSQLIYKEMTKFQKIIECKILNNDDPFSHYIYYTSKSSNIGNDSESYINNLIYALKQNFFFEAFEELLFKLENSNFVTIEKQLENTIEDAILKRIYFMYIYIYRFYKCSNFKEYFNDLIKYFQVDESSEHIQERFPTVIPSGKNEFINTLIAAVFYVQKDYEKSAFLFERSEIYYFIDLYSNILYIKNDIKGLALLCHKMVSRYILRPETHVCIGNLHSARKEHLKAVESFQKCIQLDDRFLSVYTLIAHEYYEIKDIVNTIKYLTLALRNNKNDYRACFSLAETYRNCGMDSQSLFFYKRAVELQADNGYCWLNYGVMLMKFPNKHEAAYKCFSRAMNLGENEAMRCMGDLLKKAKKFQEAVEMYEKYVETNRDGNVCKFLEEYYKENGEYDRSIKYNN